MVYRGVWISTRSRERWRTVLPGRTGGHTGSIVCDREKERVCDLMSLRRERAREILKLILPGHIDGHTGSIVCDGERECVFVMERERVCGIVLMSVY